LQRSPGRVNPFRKDDDDFNVKRVDSRRNSALVFSIVFFVVILVLAIFQNNQILLVLVLYFCILLEGVSISALMLYSRNSVEKSSTADNELKPGSLKGTDVVSSMNVYVTYAVRGSTHSRREIAYIIRNLLDENRSSALRDQNDDPQLPSDLKRVVYDYTEDNASGKAFQRKKETKSEREAYLTSLERVVMKLRADNFTS
jgi:hypothetical protein